MAERQHDVGVARAESRPAKREEATSETSAVQTLMDAGGNQAMVQLAGGDGAGDVHAAAAAGVRGGGGALPHADKIQQAFGRHDVSNVQAHVGGAARDASQAMGAQAYATGNKVAFANSPDLHTAAHEAAHVVQQQHGVSLSGGVGKAGDSYEQHADRVADAVVAGKPAEGLLDKMTGGGGGGGVQKKAVQKADDPRGASPAPAAPAAPSSGGGTSSRGPASGSRGPAPAAPSGAGASAPAGPAGRGAATPTPTPLTPEQAKAFIDGKASELGDVSEPFARALAGKTQDECDREYADVTLLRNRAISAYLDAGPARAQTQALGRPDPIAVQKFQDVDAEAHLEVPALKDTFYTNLATKMREPTYVDRTRTFPAMQASAPPATFAFKGRRIPADRISPFSARNHSVERMYNINTIAPEIDRAIEEPLAAANARPETIAAAKADENKRKKAYRHLLATGRDPMTTIDTSKPISPYGTWYAPGEIRVDASASANSEYTRMMTLGALQPEWYPHGTCVLNIERKLSAGSREIRKPTAFDGMMSALWVARNMAEDDYGVTGGGLGEFLEANVLFSEVTSARAVIPTDDFLADIQRVVTQVQNATGGQSTPTEERLRGNGQNTSILNTSAQGSQLYGSVTERSGREQNRPSPAPNAPGAASPTSSASPSGPAAASGGAYDTSRRSGR